MDVCASCGTLLTGAFCAACGQRAVLRLTTTRLTLQALATFDLERGVISTTLALFRHPGVVVLDYLRGRTNPYTSPIKHFVLILSLVQVAALIAGTTTEVAAGFVATQRAGADLGAASAAGALDRFFVLLVAPGVPILAGVQRWIFRRAGLNYAEHLVFALYVAAQQLLLLLPAFVLSGGAKSTLALFGLLTSVLASIAYYAWAAFGVFGGSRTDSLGRSLAALSLTTITYVLGLSVGLAALLTSR